ncbi:MAG: GIDE domain-containing protein, partial [Gammaproteobacteria bacterium]
MQTADPGNFWLWVFILCVVAIIGLVAGFVFLMRAWTVKEIPISLIRSAAQGYVKFEGHADLMPGPPIISPLTQSRCTWWSYAVEKRVRTGRDQSWQTVEHGTSDNLFLIRDATGQCVVDPEHAEVIPANRTVWYGDQPQPLGGPPIGGFALTSPYRYIEERIAPHDFIFALGFFRTQSDNSDAMAINDEVAQVLHAWKQDQAELLRRFDADHDGQLNDQEWGNAR